ncbi:aminoglycoside phosphotransferase family protein, partial [Streptomyces sp. NPDC006129]
MPELLAHDPEAGLFAMAYLPPERYPVRKAQLLYGEVRVATAAAVGELLGSLRARGGGSRHPAAPGGTHLRQRGQ